MRPIATIPLLLAALAGCTSTRMLQREGCWVKQTEKWPGRVSEELGFCAKPAPMWAQDRVARLVQECMPQADYRWENRALAAWGRGEQIPPQESDEQIARTCMTQASATLGPEAENAALKARLAELGQDRQALRNESENDREFLKQNSDKMVSALGEAAKKPAPAAVATATSTGTATTESELKSAQQPPQGPPATTVVELNGATVPLAQPVAAPSKLTKPAENPCTARRPIVRKIGDKPAQDEPNCTKPAQPSGPAAMVLPRGG